VKALGPSTGTWESIVALCWRVKGCALYIAPVVLRSNVVVFFGADKVDMTVDTVDQETGARTVAAGLFFYDPPNGELIEQFRQIERTTERRMVAVHKIRFPEDALPTTEAALRAGRLCRCS
jgi:hypothetical protein